MSSTILVVIVLVVMWLVVLVPMFVRRQEDDEAASEEQAAGRTRVLTRRRRADAAESSTAADLSTAHGPVWPGLAPSAFSRDQARHRMLHRRRRTLLVLQVAAGLSCGGALIVTAWFWVPQLFATAFLAGYIGWLRQQVRRERARRLRRAALHAKSAPAPFLAALWPAQPDYAALRDARPPAARRASEPNPARSHSPAPTATADGGWRPVRVPVPTYVTKPPARPTDPVASLDDDPTLADIDPTAEPFERRRAANG